MERDRNTIEIPFDTINRVDSWEDFELAICKLNQALHKIKTEGMTPNISAPLFRGHSNHEWRLDTTLDRTTGGRNFAINDYFSIASEAIETIGLNFPSTPTFQKTDRVSNFDLAMTKQNLNNYIPALAYLRHHGFPSPLLDWSQSKDVAAFFAFRDRPSNEFVSIYILVEYLTYGKIVNASKPRVSSIGNNIKTHIRHENQKSEYTVCLLRDGDIQYFTQHEQVLTKNDRAQDITLKFEIPSKERSKVMNYIIKQGITEPFLMGHSVDSLVASLTYNFFR